MFNVQIICKLLYACIPVGNERESLPDGVLLIRHYSWVPKASPPLCAKRINILLACNSLFYSVVRPS